VTSANTWQAARSCSGQGGLGSTMPDASTDDRNALLGDEIRLYRIVQVGPSASLWKVTPMSSMKSRAAGIQTIGRDELQARAVRQCERCVRPR